MRRRVWGSSRKEGRRNNNNTRSVCLQREGEHGAWRRCGHSAGPFSAAEWRGKGPSRARLGLLRRWERDLLGTARGIPLHNSTLTRSAYPHAARVRTSRPLLRSMADPHACIIHWRRSECCCFLEHRDDARLVSSWRPHAAEAQRSGIKAFSAVQRLLRPSLDVTRGAVGRRPSWVRWRPHPSLRRGRHRQHRKRGASFAAISRRHSKDKHPQDGLSRSFCLPSYERVLAVVHDATESEAVYGDWSATEISLTGASSLRWHPHVSLFELRPFVRRPAYTHDQMAMRPTTLALHEAVVQFPNSKLVIESHTRSHKAYGR